MKVWAKIMKSDKLVKDIIFEGEYSLKMSDYQSMLQEIAYRLDIATPVSLESHLKHFEKFNRTKYLPRDFVEDVDFTSFILERVLDEKKKPNQFYI
ncbi:MAG: hypothetical protein IJ226_03235 [Clostridia bacterium]|nr:hypothetical protein [Clostridia bacterium]